MVPFYWFHRFHSTGSTGPFYCPDYVVRVSPGYDLWCSGYDLEIFDNFFDKRNPKKCQFVHYARVECHTPVIDGQDVSPNQSGRRRFVEFSLNPTNSDEIRNTEQIIKLFPIISTNIVYNNCVTLK